MSQQERIEGEEPLLPAHLEERIRNLEIAIRSMELAFLKSLTELNSAVRENFLKQDNANKMLAHATDKLTDVIEKSFKDVLDSATSRDHLPMKIANKIIGTLSIMILALVVALIFSLTGIQMRWLPNFHSIATQSDNNTQYLKDLHDELERQTNVKLPEPPAKVKEAGK